jgi:hypothetical protein
MTLSLSFRPCPLELPARSVAFSSNLVRGGSPANSRRWGFFTSVLTKGHQVHSALQFIEVFDKTAFGGGEGAVEGAGEVRRTG